MDRFTKLLDDKKFYIADENKFSVDSRGYFGEAINRLGKFEDFYEELISGQSQTQKELDKLRSEGKEKSYRYKELMGKKLTENHILNLLKLYDL
ncbi:MAG: hypothetical protein PHC44_06400 [Lutispora sp.]|nr:hypothetical protein [Lutispora sp.]MDD4834346.1 hypothetical protein [Lutispora sp.]